MYLFEHLKKSDNTKVHLITNDELLDNLGKEVKVDDSIFSRTIKSRQGKIVEVFLLLSYFYNLVSYIKKNKIRKIHCCVNPSIYSVILILISLFLKFEVSISVVNSIYKKKSQLGFLGRFYWAWSLKKARKVDFLSNSIEKNMIVIFGKDLFTSSSVSPCSLSRLADSNYLNYSEQELFLCNKTIDVLFVSRLIPGKGLDILMEALRFFNEKGTVVNVTILGEGPLIRVINEEVTAFSSVNINLVGYDKDVGKYIKKSKVVLSIQQFENYPSQLLMEAASLNSLVIASDVGDTRVMLNDMNAILIPHNASDLFRAIDWGLFGEDAEPRIKQMKSNLYKHIKESQSVDSFSSYFIKFMKS